MTDPDLSSAVAAEIAALHVEFERWLRGESDDLGRIEASIGAGFTFISPRGDLVSRSQKLSNIREGHGARSIRIRIENPGVAWNEGDAVVATYEEWHDHAEYTTARISTVLLTRDDAAPGGFLWRHVHETWKIPPP